MKKLRIATGVLASMLLGLAAAPQALADAYTLTGLGFLPSDTYSTGAAINASGQVVGYSQGSDGEQGYLYSGGVMTGTGWIGGSRMNGQQSWNTGINASGQYVGSGYTPDGANTQGYISNGSGGITSIGGLPTGNGGSNALGINDSGVVVGWASDSNNIYQPITYTLAGGLQQLNVNIGNPSYGGQATAINNAGQITGIAGAADGTGHAYLYSGGVSTDLGTLPGDTNSFGNAINASGQVVGWSTDGSTYTAFLYNGVAMSSLGGLGGNFSEANAINDNGVIVGTSNTPGPGYSGQGADAWIYEDGVLTDLNTLVASSGWGLINATGINDAGDITGIGVDPDGQIEAFLLTPENLAPVPAAVWPGLAMLVVLGAAEAIRRNRGRKLSPALAEVV